MRPDATRRGRKGFRQSALKSLLRGSRGRIVTALLLARDVSPAWGNYLRPAERLLVWDLRALDGNSSPRNRRRHKEQGKVLRRVSDGLSLKCSAGPPLLPADPEI